MRVGRVRARRPPPTRVPLRVVVRARRVVRTPAPPAAAAAAAPATAPAPGAVTASYMLSGAAGDAVEVYEDPASDRRADSEGECESEYDSTDEKDDDDMEREARERHCDLG